MNKKKILCFGDSNTWGYVPNADVKNNPDERYGEFARWTGILQQLLGDRFRIIEEGLCGRTTNITGKISRDELKNGFESSIRIFSESSEIDFLIIQLGTNDLKDRFKREASDIAAGVEQVIEAAESIYKERGLKIPKIILLSPPLVFEENLKLPYRMTNALERSRALGSEYRRVSRNHSCLFIDLAEIVASSEIDGLHLDEATHKSIAEVIHEYIINEYEG